MPSCQRKALDNPPPQRQHGLLAMKTALFNINLISLVFFFVLRLKYMHKIDITSAEGSKGRLVFITYLGNLTANIFASILF